MAGVDEIAVRIVAEVEGLLAGLKNAEHAIEGMTAPVQHLSEYLTKLGEAFAAAFAVERVAELAEHFADLGEKALNTAFILGTTVEESDRVTTAMRILGVDTDTASRTLQFLGRSIQQSLIDSQSRAAVGFRNLGISMEEVRANANNLTGLLTLVIEKVNGLERAGLQGAGAMRDVLGRGMQTLAPLLRATAEEFQAAQHAAEEHTKAMVENAAGMDKTAQQMHTLGVNVETFGIKMFGLFRQDIDGVIHSLNNLLSIGDSIISFLKYLGDAFNKVNKDITDAGRAVNNFLRELAGLGPAAYADIPPKGDEPHGTRKIGTEKHGGGKGAKGTDDRMSEWRDELRQQLQDEQNFLSDSKKEELAYWQAKLALVGTGSKEDLKLRREVNAEIFNLQKQLAKQAETDAIAEQTYQQKVNDQNLSSARAHLTALESLHRITAQQRIAIEKQLIDEEIAADEDYYHKKEAAAQGDLREITKLEQEEYLLHERLVHQKAALDDQAAIARKQQLDDVLSPLKSAFASSATGVATGQQSLAQAGQNIGQAIAAEVGNKLSSVLFDKLGDLFLKLAPEGLQSALGLGGATATVTAITTSTATLSGVLTAGFGTEEGLLSAILLKPSVAGTTFQYGGIVPTAAGGWHIPSFADGGLIAKVHPGEMILPKHIADSVSDMASGGGGGGGMTIHVHANDTQTGAAFLLKHAGDIGANLRLGNMSPRSISSGGGRYP
jgi:hypothetical protein